MSIRFDAALGIHARALELRSQRAEVIAANLANADTPNYLARDVDFHAALARAQGGGAMTATDPRHLQAPGSGAGELKFRVPTQPAVDGNTVDTQHESAAFAENALHYQGSLRLLNGRIRSLISAIRGE